MKQFFTLKIVLFTIIVFLSACGEHDAAPDNSATTQGFHTEDKNFLYALFTSEYLWYDKVIPQEYLHYTSPTEMITALRYSLDIWSFAQTYAEYENSANQITQGFGMYIDANGQIFYILIDSPADKAGFQRGDIIEQINSQSANADLYDQVESSIGVQSSFSIRRGEESLTLIITPVEYNYKSVKSDIFVDTNGKKVGHLIFNEFSSASVEELDEAFSLFHENSIEELVIDLRYNLGGSLSVASILMDKIAGFANDGAPQMKLQFNENNVDQNYVYTFEADENSLSLERVVFLTGYYSASASESVINCLKPYTDVVLIGSPTHGKPVGMVGKLFNDYIYWLINFSVYNANNEGDYYNGIDVDCFAEDNINYPRDNLNEDMLKEALYYIEHDSCSS